MLKKQSQANKLYEFITINAGKMNITTSGGHYIIARYRTFTF